jgi:hypothetical protein
MRRRHIPWRRSRSSQSHRPAAAQSGAAGRRQLERLAAPAGPTQFRQPVSTCYTCPLPRMVLLFPPSRRCVSERCFPRRASRGPVNVDSKGAIQSIQHTYEIVSFDASCFGGVLLEVRVLPARLPSPSPCCTRLATLRLSLSATCMSGLRPTLCSQPPHSAVLFPGARRLPHPARPARE